MARPPNKTQDYSGAIRRILIGILVFFLLAIFVLWRIDSVRVERLRNQIIDSVVPNFSWASAPVTGIMRMVDDFQAYDRIYNQNQELRRELQQMSAWKEAALQLEQQNAKLLDLNNVRLAPKLTFVTGVVIADAGSQFRQSVLLNVGARDGIIDGWAVTDGLGLAGRISGVGANTSRVLLLTDGASRMPVTVLPSGQQAILSGDSSPVPTLEFVEKPDLVRPGDSVVSSGDGGVFPNGLLIGHVVRLRDNRLRVRLSADYERLEFLRVLRSHANPVIDNSGNMIVAPAAETIAPLPAETDTPTTGGDNG
ncbi:Rod shape-determining protein, MreC [Rhodobacteraceae bacterium HTCC2150]|nr:Rod shape-determining protein, MreC [Rhodobacteraceae bacterium HTCC2150]